MQTNVFVRAATEADKPEMLAWLKANADNNWFDEDVLSYPLAKVLVAYRSPDNKVLAYLPIQPIMMLDSLAPNPEVKGYELAAAMRALVGAAVLTASDIGIQEVAFWSTNNGTSEAAASIGFKSFPLSLMRLKMPQVKAGEESQVSACV